MIGLFDSGSGGLSVLQAIRKRKPTTDVVYFGDIKHAPYGTRPEHELVHLTTDGLRTLRMFGAQEIVSACNTVAPTVLKHGAEDRARFFLDDTAHEGKVRASQKEIVE